MKSKNKISILVTGGSGFIGTNLMNYLIENKYRCINLDFRPPVNREHLDYWVDVDICKYDEFQNAIKQFKPSHIIHLAATLGMDHKSLNTLEANINGVQNLINIISAMSLERVLFISSLLVCKGGYIPKNDTDYCAPNFYGKSKVLGERKIREGTFNCEWAIIRPTSIWGPWFDYSYKKFFEVIDRNIYFHIPNNEIQKPAAFVGNMVYMMIKILLENDSTINKSTFYLADYPWYSSRIWANQIQKTIGAKPIKTAPMWLIKIIACFGSIIKFLLRYDPPLTLSRLNNMHIGGDYPVENTKRIVGKLPFSLNDSVYLTAKWMYENNLIKHSPKDHEK